MIIYWLSCLASVAVIYLGMKTDRGRKYQREVLFFSAMPLILVAALRYDVGEDYLSTYVSYFEMVQKNVLPANQKVELLYHWLNQITVWLGCDYVWLFAVCAAAFYLLVISQIMLDSPSPALSVFLLTGMGYVFVFFNAMRQMVGCALLLYSCRYIQRKKLLLFLFCVLIASGFHSSCGIFAIVYFFDRIKVRPIQALILSLTVAVLGGVISAVARTLIAKTHYGIYLSSVFDTGRTGYVMLAINAVLLFILSFFYDKDNRQYQMYYNLQILSLWMTLLSGKIVLIVRVLWMFGLPSVISLPIALSRIKETKERKLITAMVVLMYTAYMLITVGLQNSNSVLPYQTVFGRWI